MPHLAILDDNETWCYVLALRLEQQGYRVSTFTSAQALLREVEQFDLVLVDFSIPAPRYQRSMDGTEVICQVKQHLEHPPLLVLISSFFTQDILAEADRLCPEADAVLSKQSETNELLAQIQMLLAHSLSLEESAVR
ncbi:response regulator [Leptolyngbya ohadii]|uniref:response regulator n=1 Tax=Leptolyngbya ohadii TaxID=1962290 RepID=UPI000B59A491|nr:response regulator [Leptolyngbya ohadii]